MHAIDRKELRKFLKDGYHRKNRQKIRMVMAKIEDEENVNFAPYKKSSAHGKRSEWIYKD